MSLIKTERIPEPVNIATIDKVIDKALSSKQVENAVAHDDKLESKKQEQKKEQMEQKEPKKEEVDQKQFITKYRPDEFDQVLGNEKAIQRLIETIKHPDRLHTYMFIGSTGVGKTTLARIIAKHLDATLFETSAAEKNSVEDTRTIAETVKFKPITGKPAILLILDECHNFSKQAWEPLLKLIEDPPPYFYCALCTTDATKIPDTITQGRVFVTNLKPLKQQEIESLVSVISDLEGWTLKNDVFNAIVQTSAGSARHALTILLQGHSCESVEELSEVVIGVESENSPVFKLYTLLMNGGDNWKAVSRVLEKIAQEIGQDHERGYTAATDFLCNLFAKALTRSEDQQARRIGRMLCCFTNINSYFPKVKFYSAISKIMWNDIPF